MKVIFYVLIYHIQGQYFGLEKFNVVIYKMLLV